MSNKPINVLVVDDHHVVRSGIKRILTDAVGIRVVGECSSGEDALQFIRNHQTDVVLMDIAMPGVGGFETTRRLLRVDADLKIVILTAYSADPLPSNLMKIGAAGYLTKSCTAEEMVQVIRNAYVGKRYMSPDIAQKLAMKVYSAKEESPLDLLSKRELQVLLMVSKGIKAVDISEQLCLSPKTVNSYRYRLFQKLGVKSDVELTHYAIRFGLIDVESSDFSLEPVAE